MKYVDIYCDESGNSGGNFLDSQQPVYVLAGWSIDKNKRFLADKIIQRFHEKYYPDKPELKGSEILKSNEGQIRTNELFDELGKLGCNPLFVIAEKRYCVAGKIVEAFFDSENNNRVHPSFSWMNDMKKEITEIIYKVSVQSIEKYATMHKNASIENVKDLQLTVMNELMNSGHQNLAYVVEGSSDYIENILWEEDFSKTAMPKKALHSLNLPIFVSFIQLAEKANRTKGNKARMFHDETKQFEDSYAEVFNLFKNAPSFETVLENGMTILGGFRSIKSLRLMNSVNTPMVQAADLLASFINKYATNICLNKKITPEMKKLGQGIVASNLISMKGIIQLSDTVGSKNFKRKITSNVTDFPINEQAILK